MLLEQVINTVLTSLMNEQVTPTLIMQRVVQAAKMFKAQEEVINAATIDLRKRFAVQTEVGQAQTIISEALVGNNNAVHVNWLIPERQGGYYWLRYRSYLWNKQMPPKVVEELDASTNSILGSLEDPRREGAWDRRGLVVGHIQSGKTQNYCGLVCKAADAGYKIIIVLAGIHNNLRSQTQIRLEEGFLGYQTPRNANTERIGVGKITVKVANDPSCLTTRLENGDLSPAAMRHLAVQPEPQGNPWLFVVKKNARVLDGLLTWIKNNNVSYCQRVIIRCMRMRM